MAARGERFDLRLTARSIRLCASIRYLEISHGEPV
jgi:hypothetical protein